MEKEQGYRLIKKYLLNELTKSELKHFLDGMDDPETEKLYSDLMEVSLEDQIKNRANQPFIGDTERARKIIRSAKWAARRSVFYKVAAVALLFIGVYWMYRQSGAENRLQEQIPLGTKKTIELSDHTVVHANAGSMLTFPDEFLGNTREIGLTGEAFFEVSKDPEKPFIIDAGDFSVKVLGTSFNVSCYPNDEESTVTVVEGRVVVQIDQEWYDLRKNQKLIYDHADDRLQLLEVDAELETGWKEGILVFNKTPFDQVQRDLERWYDVEIEVQDSTMYSRQIYGQHKHESLEEMLESLAFMLDFSYEINQKHITIKKGAAMSE